MQFQFLTLLLILEINTSSLGDTQPYCRFPENFQTSLKPYNGYVDLLRYSGLWYEVVRKAGIEFQDQCLCVTAEYGLVDDYVSVTNTCGLGQRGSFQRSAKAYSWNQNNTTLKVYFEPQIGGNYYILNISSDYQWAVVGDPCREYFWILSRNPSLDQQIIEQQLQMLQNQGFDVSQLRRRRDLCRE